MQIYYTKKCFCKKAGARQAIIYEQCYSKPKVKNENSIASNKKRHLLVGSN